MFSGRGSVTLFLCEDQKIPAPTVFDLPLQFARNQISDNGEMPLVDEPRFITDLAKARKQTVTIFLGPNRGVRVVWPVCCFVDEVFQLQIRQTLSAQVPFVLVQTTKRLAR